MRPWLRRTLIGVFGASLLATAFAAGACYRHRWTAMSDADLAKVQTRVVDHLGRRLDLDEAQKARLSTLGDQLRAQRQAFGGPGAMRSEIASLVAGPSFDRAKAQSLVEAKTAAVGSASPALIAAFGDFFDSLRPEQQAKLRELMIRGGHHGWRG